MSKTADSCSDQHLSFLVRTNNDLVIPMKKSLSKLLLLCLFLPIVAAQGAEDQWQDVGRIVAIGDVHGDYENFVDVLKSAGIINRRRNWNADDTHFVQLGDLPDRGPDTDKIIELIRKLERQAARDGGMVHALIGNHEAMNMLGDLRFVHAGEYQALKSSTAGRLRDRLFALEVERRTESDPEFEADREFRNSWYQQTPLGYVEHRLAWNPEGKFGSWIAGHNTLIKINRTLFIHGGIGPESLGQSIREINDYVRAELTGTTGEEQQLLDSDTGPLWYRGLALNDELSERAHVDAVLDFYDADRIVIGHTPSFSTIIPRFGGKVLMIDTGISDYYGAHLSSLLIEEDELFTIQRGEVFKIPSGDEALLPYLEAIAEVEPDSESLQQRILELDAQD